MPTGTGKTISLLSMVISWILAHRTPDHPYKLIYCCRTIGEVEKTMEELRRLWAHILTHLSIGPELPFFASQFLALALASRKSLCVHPDVNSLGKRTVIDAKCHGPFLAPTLPPAAVLTFSVSDMTAPHVRDHFRREHGPIIHPDDIEDSAATPAAANILRSTASKLCSYFEGYVSATGGDPLILQQSTKAASSAARKRAERKKEDPDAMDVDEADQDEDQPLHSLTGIYSLEEMKAFAENKGICPYFLTRYLIQRCDVVIYSYQYLLNPRIHQIVSQQLKSDAIVVFDEAHNMDNVCIEALSVKLNRTTVEAAAKNVRTLNQQVSSMKQKDIDRLNAEYRRLLRGLNLEVAGPSHVAPISITQDPAQIAVEPMRANPTLSEEVTNEIIPESIRKASEFLGVLDKVIQYLRTRISVKQVFQESPSFFLKRFGEAMGMADTKPLRFCTGRLNSLLKTIEITNLDKYQPIGLVADFATLASTYEKEGFIVLMEPYEPYEFALATRGLGSPLHNPQTAANAQINAADLTTNPRLELSCLDASIAMKAVLAKFPRVVITSGTLSPPGMLPRILGMKPALTLSLSMSLQRTSVCPLVVTRGSDQTPISTKFDMRSNLDVARNYASLLLEFAKIVPDGMVCFFPSYQFMEMMVSVWNEMGMLHKLIKYKLLFVETEDLTETSLALQSYKKACDSGRGAVFLSVARGKVSEGIDFDNHYGRCVILFGIPFVYTESRTLKARLEFLRQKFQIHENEFLTFDAMRMASQCVGRVVRGKGDYGIMVFADKRYNRIDKRSKLPQWITQFLGPNQLNLSTDTATSIAKTFLKEMGQPMDRDAQIGVSLWSEVEILQQPASRPFATAPAPNRRS